MLLNTDRYLERKIDRFLQVWQETIGHKPLLIKGARQIGKTEAVRHFARGRYAYFHEINFWGVKLHGGNAGCENHVLTLPYWCAFLLPRLLRDAEALERLGLKV